MGKEMLFKDKNLLITGGTGSFGNAVVKRFLNTEIHEIRIFSRDEKKQDEMRKRYSDPKIKFYLGDVRDYQSVVTATRGANFIFHAAALKQVPSCEFYPLEAIKTNVLGTENVLTAAANCNVDQVVALSTDKAVYPVNAMGMSKALMEKVVVAKSRTCEGTIFNITRYGNVMNSRGSVIPLFASQIRSGQPITITDPNMTRFMMTLDEAVELVIFAFENGKSGEIFVQKSPAAKIKTLADALINLMKQGAEHETHVIGTRHGEKLYEVLLSREEMIAADDLGRYFRVKPDSRDLNYGRFFEDGEPKINEACEYSSHNTYQLDFSEMCKILNNSRIL
jgi:UDP-N-acetylglucosamine 4,6-dehydratase/5-epimerase